MNLSRLILNPLCRDVARAIRDAQQLHRLVLLGFGDADGAAARAKHGVLHRLEIDHTSGALALYVQSASAPDWSRLPAGALAILSERNPETRPLHELDAIATGRVARFRLRANATRKIDTKSIDGNRRNGRRVPLRDDPSCIDWLARKGVQHGFELVRDARDNLHLSVLHEPLQRGHRNERPLTFEGVRFDGHLRIVDADHLRAAVLHGIGPGKAYGFGLLSVAPIHG